MNRIVSRMGLMLAAAMLSLAFTTALALDSHESKPLARAEDPQIGQRFDVPYRLTDTNHFLVRVRINGKGPFNFLVDSGAPALFVATETAKKIGLRPDQADFWTSVDWLDLEGGAWLR